VTRERYEIDSFAFDELLFCILDQLTAGVEVRGDLVEAASPGVDLCRAAAHGLLHQPLAFGERLPRLLELVPLRHPSNHARRVRSPPSGEAAVQCRASLAMSASSRSSQIPVTIANVSAGRKSTKVAARSPACGAPAAWTT